MRTLSNGIIYLILSLIFMSISYGQVTIYLEDFNAGIGTFSAVSITDAADVWTPTSGYMEMNGFGGSDDEDWLISPAINMDAQTDEYFMFDYYDSFDGSLIELYYSTNYNNGGTPADVSAATWTQLPIRVFDMNATSCISPNVFQRNPAVDIGAITGTSVYFAFKYTGTAANSKQYWIDNVHIDASYYTNVTPGLTCEPLKTELHDLIAVQADRIRYTSSTLYDVWDAVLQADRRLNDAGTATIVYDMFTDFPTTTGEFEFDHCANRDGGSCPGGEGVCYNREHSFAKSYWGGGTTLSDTIYTDMHHIYPADRSMNTIKSNYPPGNVQTASSTGSNGFAVGTNTAYPCTPATGSKKYFEPIDEYKGDYARTFFYVVTRYQHNMVAWQPLNSQGACFMDGTAWPSIQSDLLLTLLQWHAADPVSQKEIDHNNAVYAIQGNRNPYIDNPGYVYLVWGDEFGTPCNLIVLPVELSAFDAHMDRDWVDLDWETTTENNSDYFTIERSTDLYNWTEIDHMNAAGNSVELIHYRTVDPSPQPGMNYYRLKEVDVDGMTAYSEVRGVENNVNAAFFPNPTHDQLHIHGKHIANNIIAVYDVFGRPINEALPTKKLSDDELLIDLSQLSPDVYIIRAGDAQARVVKL